MRRPGACCRTDAESREEGVGRDCFPRKALQHPARAPSAPFISWPAFLPPLASTPTSEKQAALCPRVNTAVGSQGPDRSQTPTPSTPPAQHRFLSPAPLERARSLVRSRSPTPDPFQGTPSPRQRYPSAGNLAERERQKEHEQARRHPGRLPSPASWGGACPVPWSPRASQFFTLSRCSSYII